MRKLLTVLLGAILVLLLALHTLPYLVRDQLVLWFYQQGVEDARLRSLSVNWLNGRLTIDKLALKRDGFSPLVLDQLKLDIDLSALIDKQVRIEQLAVHGLQGGLSDEDNRLWLGPLSLPVSEDQDETVAGEDSAASEWQVGLDQLDITDLAWLTRWQGQRYPLQIAQAQLSHLYQWAPVTETEFNLKGQFDGSPLALDSRSYPLQASPEFNATITTDRFSFGSLAALAQLPLSGQLSSNLELKAQLNPLKISVDGDLTLAKLDWNAEQTAQLSQLTWKGQAGWSQETQNADLAGTLNLQGVKLSLPEPQLAITLAGLRWQGQNQAQIGDTLKNDLNGTLNLNDLKLSMAAQQAAVALDALQWRGRSALVKPAEGALNVTSEQSLMLSGLNASQDALKAQLVSLENQSLLELEGDKWQVALPELSATGFEAYKGEVSLAQLQSLKAEEGLFSASQAELAQLTVEELQLAQLANSDKRQPISQWATLQLHQFGWKPEQLAIQRIELGGGESRIRRGKQGELTDVEALQQLFAVPAEDQASEQSGASGSASKQPMQVKVEEVIVTNPHKLLFTDRSVKPRFKFKGELSSLSVGPYDNASEKATDLLMKARLNGDGQLNLKGKLDLASGLENGDWVVNIQGVEMPYLSPYSMFYTGYYLRSGQFNLVSEGKLTAGQLEGSNQIRLHNFDVEPREQDKVGQISQQLSMPLETAVMVLEDDDENIELDLDLSGSLDDPNFGYQSVINSLAGKGLKTAAFSYLTKALQPYATLISLAQTAIDANQKGTFINLQPVMFTAGNAGLNSDMRGYLDKLTGMMTERPAMRLKLCGAAVAADAEVLQVQLEKENAKRKKPLPEDDLAEELQQQLQNLAEQRSEAVKAQLAKSVDKERLFICYPTVDATSTEPPHLSVGL